MSTIPSKEQLLEALEYPTTVMREEIDISTCKHSGTFHREDEECITCYQTPECEWLMIHDHASGSSQLNYNQLLTALQFACDYMHARLSVGRHAPTECPCEGCTWWRSASRLLKQKQQIPA